MKRCSGLSERGATPRGVPRAPSKERLTTRKHRQIGVEHHALDPSHPKRSKPVFVLEPAELALDGGPTTAEVAPALRLAGKERVPPVSLEPHRLRLANPS